MAPSVIPVPNLDALKSLQNQVGPSTLIVLYFHAPWAEPCVVMSQGVQALAEEYAPPSCSADLSSRSVVFAQVEAEDAVDISSEFNIESVPYTHILQKGKTVEEIPGGSIVSLRTALSNRLARSDGASNAHSSTALPPPQPVNPRDTSNLSVEPASAPAGSAQTSTAGGNNTPPTTAEDKQQSEKELFKQLGDLVKASPVMLFMKGTPSAPECGFSRKIVALLREKSIRYGFFNILANQRVREGLKKFADWPTYPQLWVQGELVGGLDIVVEEFENNPDFMNDYKVPVPGMADAK